jgi:hypothetical protein
MAAVDAAGFPTRPASNELIESAWGTAIRDRVIVATGSGAWIDGTQLGNAIVDLFTVTIPAQAIATTLHIVTTWQARATAAPGGTTATGDVYILNPPGTPLAPVGPFRLDTDPTIWNGLSQSWTQPLAAGANPSYKVRFSGNSGSGFSRVYASTWYLLVVA